MLSSFPSRHRDFIWFLIFTFALYSMPHLELLFPYKLGLFVNQAEAAEASEASDPKEEEPPPDDGDEKEPPTDGSMASGAEPGSSNQILPGVTFTVDDFTGSAHLNYPITVPPGRGGIA
jgi:hypothetical protein